MCLCYNNQGLLMANSRALFTPNTEGRGHDGSCRSPSHHTSSQSWHVSQLGSLPAPVLPPQAFSCCGSSSCGWGRRRPRHISVAGLPRVWEHRQKPILFPWKIVVTCKKKALADQWEKKSDGKEGEEGKKTFFY